MSTASTTATSKTTKARKTTKAAKPARDFDAIAGVLDAAKAMPMPETAAYSSPSEDRAARLNRAMSLAFAAFAISEAGGRASVSFGFGDPILDIGVSDVLGLEGDGQRLEVTAEVGI